MNVKAKVIMVPTIGNDAEAQINAILDTVEGEVVNITHVSQDRVVIFYKPAAEEATGEEGGTTTGGNTTTDPTTDPNEP